MSKLKDVKISYLLIITFLIIAFLFPVNFVKAGEIEDITPDMGFDFFILLERQSVTARATQTTPFDFHTVGIVSTGNITLSASLSITGTDVLGFWWASIIGTGGNYWYDFKYGIAPVSGPSAIIDVDDALSFAFATGGVYLTSPVSVEEPVRYTLTVTGAGP